jgi:hypothetical protein
VGAATELLLLLPLLLYTCGSNDGSVIMSFGLSCLLATSFTTRPKRALMWIWLREPAAAVAAAAAAAAVGEVAARRVQTSTSIPPKQ